MIILVMSIVLKQLAVVLVVDVAVILLSIIIIILYLCFNKQYYIEYKKGVNITVAGGFCSFRKYFINDNCYIVKNGQVEPVTAKNESNINFLFSEMEKNKIIKKVHENQEIYLTEQTNKDNWLDAALGGGAPLKYGTMAFTNGKFNKGYYVSTKKSIHVNFKVIKYDIDCKDIIPQSILNLLDNYNID